MTTEEELALEVATRIAPKFRTFGGGDLQGRASFSPVAAALKHGKLEFSAGVDVVEVVRAVLAASREIAAERAKDAGA